MTPSHSDARHTARCWLRVLRGLAAGTLPSLCDGCARRGRSCPIEPMVQVTYCRQFSPRNSEVSDG